MAYMSEDGYNKLLAELKNLEAVEPRATCLKMQSMMLPKKRRACWRQRLPN